MKESRVSKYKKYRDSISKKSKKSNCFSTPSKEEKVSAQMELFLKLEKRNTMINLMLVTIILIVVILLVAFGIALF